MKFGDKLIMLRKKKGLSQEELAEKLGVSRQSVSKWESNNSYPETDKIVQICNIFDCSMDDLINENIDSIENIERKNKNTLNIALDSFLEFITKTINMFCDMKFISGLKCVIEIFILISILSILGLIFVGFSSYVVSNLFSFVPGPLDSIIHKIIESIFIVLWCIVSLIILVHVFKIRYLDYYDKVLNDKDTENSKEFEIEKQNKKIKLEKKPKIIIRDEKHRPFAFLSILSKIIIFFIKFMLAFFALMLIFSLIFFAALFVISICLFTTSIIFVGSSITLASIISINIIILLLTINFIFSKNSNYKLMLIIFMVSVVLCGIGIGISTISIKNIQMQTDSDIKTVIKEEKIKYDEDMVITNTYNLDDIEYIVDESLNNDIKLEIEYDDKFYSYDVIQGYDNYGLHETNINLYSNINFAKLFNQVTKDLKNNIIRDYNNQYLNVKVISSKKVIDKLIENTKLLYFVDEEKTEKGYMLSNFEHRIYGYLDCHGKYNVKNNTVTPSSNVCTCDITEEKTNRGTAINYSCEIN